MSDWQNVDGFAAIRRRRRLEIIFPYHSDSAAVRQMLRRFQFGFHGNRQKKIFFVEFEAVFAV